MSTAYESPTITSIGDFGQDTGAFIGPNVEQIFWFEEI